jgi:hypothetical protein
MTPPFLTLPVVPQRVIFSVLEIHRRRITNQRTANSTLAPPRRAASLLEELSNFVCHFEFWTSRGTTADAAT